VDSIDESKVPARHPQRLGRMEPDDSAGLPAQSARAAPERKHSHSAKPQPKTHRPFGWALVRAVASTGWGWPHTECNWRRMGTKCLLGKGTASPSPAGALPGPLAPSISGLAASTCASELRQTDRLVSVPYVHLPRTNIFVAHGDIKLGVSVEIAHSDACAQSTPEQPGLPERSGGRVETPQTGIEKVH
jgi:hypothetical protein